jgi:hypothetical protein
LFNKLDSQPYYYIYIKNIGGAVSSPAEREQIARKRLRNILRKQVVASARTLEQKISDSGPNNQRVDPHIITTVRNLMIAAGEIKQPMLGGIRWYHLTDTEPATVKKKLDELIDLHNQTQRRQLGVILGQALEIAAFRALQTQTNLEYFGHFPDLDTHDDSTLYRKVEPPSFLSGRQISGELDFLVDHQQAGYAGLELKNVREWFYPDRSEVRDLLLKCCTLNVVPVLIARRIHYSTFSILNPCGVIIHQTFNQLYPNSAKDLADKVKDKTLLGYHDVRVGNNPDGRLIRFIHKNLPEVLPKARQDFDTFKDLLLDFANGEQLQSFVTRVRTRMGSK